MSEDFSDKVRRGCACRFCEREFIDLQGQTFCHGELTVCKDCRSLMRFNPDYRENKFETKQGDNYWQGRRKEIFDKIENDLNDEYNPRKTDMKVSREFRLETFEKYWLPRFNKAINQPFRWDEKKQCYSTTIEKDKKMVTVDFYPKSNKLLIRNENRWYAGGLQWLLKKVLPKAYQ